MYGYSFLPGNSLYNAIDELDMAALDELDMAAVRAATASEGGMGMMFAADPTLSPPDFRPMGPQGEKVGVKYIVHIEMSPIGLWSNSPPSTALGYVSSTGTANLNTCKVSILVDAKKITWDEAPAADAPKFRNWFNSDIGFKPYFVRLVALLRNMLLNLTVGSYDEDDEERVFGGEIGGSGWMQEDGRFHWPFLGAFKYALFTTSFRLGGLHDEVYHDVAKTKAKYKAYIEASISRFFSGRIGFSRLDPKVIVTKSSDAKITMFSMHSNEEAYPDPESRRKSTNVRSIILRETGGLRNR